MHVSHIYVTCHDGKLRDCRILGNMEHRFGRPSQARHLQHSPAEENMLVYFTRMGKLEMNIGSRIYFV